MLSSKETLNSNSRQLYSIPMRVVAVSKQARRDLGRLPRNLSRRVMAKINQLAENPDSLANNVIALKGEEILRLRVGDWRIIFSINDEQVTVYRIAPRGSAYR
jgi:mRNA interferase RelE/StbE